MDFLTYNPSKPSRYGFLLKEFNEVSFPFAHRVEAFFGKPRDVANALEFYQPTTLGVTLRLCYDNFYTSYELAKELLERGIQSTGNI